MRHKPHPTGARRSRVSPASSASQRWSVSTMSARTIGTDWGSPRTARLRMRTWTWLWRCKEQVAQDGEDALLVKLVNLGGSPVPPGTWRLPWDPPGLPGA
eukprot:13952579-Heterocapsa_arctica.AAC.1